MWVSTIGCESVSSAMTGCTCEMRVPTGFVQKTVKDGAADPGLLKLSGQASGSGALPLSLE